MGNMTLDSSSFSEQLGLYDFFNVLIAGTTFVLGFCAINVEVKNYIWSNMTLVKGLGLILIIYLVGLLIQELGSALDSHKLDIYTGMNRRILCGSDEIDVSKDDSSDKKKTIINGMKGIFKHTKGSKPKSIIENPLLLRQYRHYADELLDEVDKLGKVKGKNSTERYNNRDVNGLMFSVSQYYVSACGKDRKVEKMRALFSMSKTLMACFWMLSFFAFFNLLFVRIEVSIHICSFIGFSDLSFSGIIDKLLFANGYAVIGIMFYLRAKKIMHRFLLILLGTYDAIVRMERNTSNACPNSVYVQK